MNKKLLSKMLEDISIDIYCDIEDDNDCISGFETAKQFHQQIKTKQLGGNNYYYKKYKMYKQKYLQAKYQYATN